MKLFGNRKKTPTAADSMPIQEQPAELQQDETDAQLPETETCVPDEAVTENIEDLQPEETETAEEVPCEESAPLVEPPMEQIPVETDGTKAEKKPLGKKIAIIALGCLCAVLLLFGAAVGGSVLYVNQLETVYPHVTIAGIALGGMTQNEAEEALTDIGMDDLNNTAITVQLPGGEIELSFRDIGLLNTAEESAEIACEYGKDGSSLRNSFQFWMGMIGGHDLSQAVFSEVSDEALQALIEQPLAEIRETLKSDITIDAETNTLTLVKSANTIELREDKIVSLIQDAIEAHHFGVVTYEPHVSHKDQQDVEDLREQFCAEMANAYYDKENDTIVPEVIGIAFDDEVVKAQWDAAAVGERVTLDVTVTMPEVTAEQLEELLFSKELAKNVTSVKNSSEGRKNNVRKACEALNGLVVMPGEQISYNALLGERTKENGYEMAPAYANGQVVQEYGGGICQVSSALYYCSLLSNLQIDQRSNHTFQVSYLAPGYDATVSWGSPDLKITNNREYPIRIHAEVIDDKDLSFSIWGTDDGTYVKMTTSTSAIYGNPEFPTVQTGFWTQATRWVYDTETNELIKKEKQRAGEYKYHEENIVYPSPSPEVPEETPVPEEPTVPPTPVVTPTPEQPTTPPTEQPTTPPTPEQTPVPETPTTPPTEQPAPPTENPPEPEPDPVPPEPQPEASDSNSTT